MVLIRFSSTSLASRLTGSWVLFLVAAVSLAGSVSAPWKKARLAALPEEERKWLTEFVAPIIHPEEEKLFLELVERYQRESFKEEFWARREKVGLHPPMGPGHRLRYEDLRRLADSQYDGWKQDAGRLVIRYGEPAAIEKTDLCDDLLRGVELWTYNNLGASSHQQKRFILYRGSLASPRRLWDASVPDSALFNPGKAVRLEDVARRCRTPIRDPGERPEHKKAPRRRPGEPDPSAVEPFRQPRRSPHRASDALRAGDERPL